MCMREYKDVMEADRSFLAFCGVLPRVGVFWYDTLVEKVYGDAAPFTDVRDTTVLLPNGQTLYHPLRDHFEAWSRMVKKNRKWQGIEYEDVPRGRVTLISGPQGKRVFRVLFCVDLDTPLRRKKILDFFGIPENYTEFDSSDIHYMLNPDYDELFGD